MDLLKVLTNSLSGGRTKKVLYHYTTAEGLLGIFNTSSLHLSEHQFLNDIDEIKYGNLVAHNNIMELLHEQYRNKEKEVTLMHEDIGFLNRILEFVEENEKRLQLGQFYIGCFSEVGDDLGQWKGYSNFGEGFSIGIETDSFLKGLSKKHLFAKVIYNRKKQSELIKTILNALLMASKEDAWKNRSSELASVGARYLLILSCFFKNNKFSYEKEWRLLYINSSLHIENIKCKSGKFGLHNYYEYSFDRNSIKEVIVGPKYDFKLNFNSLNVLFNFEIKIRRAQLRIK